MLWIIMAVTSSLRDGLILCLFCAQITQHFMKDLNKGRCFQPCQLAVVTHTVFCNVWQEIVQEPVFPCISNVRCEIIFRVMSAREIMVLEGL